MAEAIEKLCTNSKLVADYSDIVVSPRYGAQERPLDLFRGFSVKQTHDILHHRSIARQRDPAIIAREAKLLLRHGQELADERRAEGNGTSNRAPSAVYTAQWPLPARDDDAVLQQSSAVAAFCRLPPADTILCCNFLAN
uniref:Uncharacterized protein n=1 Tax=Oryza punctata TaxID=4537 RepID=A0A0E0M435_ORYPU